MGEYSPSIEAEKPYSSRIELHFFRHSIKESDVVSETDHGVRTSREGKRLLKQDTFSNVNLDQAVAFGSPRDRAQEAAGFMMAGHRDDITEDDTLESLKEKLDAELKYGSKIGVDHRLDFHESRTGSPVARMLYAAMDRGEYAKAIIEDSDKMAEEIGDASGANYSFKAAGIASVIEKYMKVAPRWDQLVAEKSGQYTDTLERYFGTHQGMSESFLAKVIEKTQGLESRARFIEAFSKQGFDFNKGFGMEILTGPHGEQALKINMIIEGKDDVPGHVLDQEVSAATIREIIQEGTEGQRRLMGMALRRRREEGAVAESTVAERANLSVEQIQAMESGEYPDVPDYVRVVEAMGYPAADFARFKP